MNENIKIVRVTTKEQLEELRNICIFTWVGMSDEEQNLEAIYEDLKKTPRYGKDTITFYIFKGNLMNESYNLKGTNRYPDDLTFVSVKDFYDPFAKIVFGARWLDDIIDNDIERNENE